MNDLNQNAVPTTNGADKVAQPVERNIVSTLASALEIIIADIVNAAIAERLPSEIENALHLTDATGIDKNDVQEIVRDMMQNDADVSDSLETLVDNTIDQSSSISCMIENEVEEQLDSCLTDKIEEAIGAGSFTIESEVTFRA